jgi:hypothetical protein
MFSALSRFWQRQFHSGRASRPARRSRGAFRPRLEALEDRCVPTVWSVTSSADNINQLGTLRWAVANAHNDDTIDIGPLDGLGHHHIVLLHGELFLNQSVTIEGLGEVPTTIDGYNWSRVFEVSRRAVVDLKNLDIIHGNAKANNPLGNAGLDGDGGAILNEGQLFMDRCLVKQNGRTWEGGYNSQVKEGGGIYNYHNAFLFLGASRVDENFANIAGGGIYNDQGAVAMADTFMMSNSTNHAGGAIYNSYGTVELDLRNTLFQNSAERGGAICNSGGTVKVFSSDLEQNSASHFGGAVFNKDGWLDVWIGSTLKDNRCFTGGGGIYNLGGDVSIADSYLINNSCKMGNGGGIDSNGGAVDLTNARLDNNTATGGVGGGMYDFGSTVTVTDSHLDVNSALAGGGIYNNAGNLMVTNSDLTFNTASFFGGAIATLGGTVQVTGSTLTDNSGAGAGGAIFNSGGTVKVGTSFFMWNPPNTIDGPWIDLGGNTFV